MLEFSLLCLQRLDMESILEKIHPHLDSIHLDIMDGIFVEPTAFSTKFVDEFKTDLPKHVHVMSFEPEIFLDKLNNITSFSYHFETTVDHHYLISKIKNKNFKAGLVIKPETKIPDVEPYFEDLDRVILMAVEPGYSAQKYLSETSKKISEIRNNYKNIEIVIDGGMHEDTMREVMTLGANSCVVCSVIVKSDDPVGKIKSLKQSGSYGVDNRNYILNNH